MATKKTTTKAVPSELQLKVLELLSKNEKGLTRAELSKKLSGAWIGSDLMGHADPKKQKPTSLVARGYIKASDGEGATVYSITAAGKKALTAKAEA